MKTGDGEGGFERSPWAPTGSTTDESIYAPRQLQVIIFHVSLIPARYHTFVEIDHEIISTVILLPSADLFKKGCFPLQAKVCAQISG